MKGGDALTDELIGRKMKSDLMGFLEIANNSSLNDMLRNPQNRLEVMLDFFRKLQEAAHSSTLKLSIPDTLCQRDGQPLHIYSETGNDTVRFREGSSAINSFVQRIEDNSAARAVSAGAEVYPYAIVLDEIGGHKVCLSIAEVHKRWQEAKSQFKIMQQFVIPKVKEIIKYRIIWVKDRQPLVFLITRSGTQANVVKQSDDRRYLHDINVFSYAGRLLRSSFSPFLPHSSNLQESLLEKQSGISTHTHTKKHMIIGTRPKSKFSLVKSAKRIPQIESMASVICDILRSKVLHSQDDIRLLIFDVSQGQDSIFRLLNVKGMLCSSKDPSLSTSMVRSFETKSERTLGRLNSKHSASKSRELLNALHRDSQSEVVSKKCPYIDLKEANERKVSIYTLIPRLDRSAPEINPKPKSRLRVYCSDLLSETAEMYDSMRICSSSQKRFFNSHDLTFTKYPAFMDILLDKFFHRMQDTSLSYYFKGKDMQFAKAGLIKAISGKEGYTFRFKLRKIHAGMSISLKEFDAFMSALALQLREDGIPEVDVNYVQSRLIQYKAEVVEPSSPEGLRSSKKH